MQNALIWRYEKKTYGAEQQPTRNHYEHLTAPSFGEADRRALRPDGSGPRPDGRPGPGCGPRAAPLRPAPSHPAPPARPRPRRAPPPRKEETQRPPATPNRTRQQWTPRSSRPAPRLLALEDRAHRESAGLLVGLALQVSLGALAAGQAPQARVLAAGRRKHCVRGENTAPEPRAAAPRGPERCPGPTSENSERRQRSERLQRCNLQ